MDVKQERRDTVKAQRTCWCPHYPFPHRAGSLRMCEHHPRFGEEPTQDEMMDYQIVIETQRGN